MIYENAEQIRALKSMKNVITEKAQIPENHDYDMNDNTRGVNLGRSGDIFKAYIPFFLYKPPFGYPRRDIDIANVRKLASSPFIWSIKKTIKDRITAIPWDIVVKDDREETPALHAKAQEIKHFFENPNRNFDSFSDVQSAFLDDILVFDSGAIEKIFDTNHKFSQMYARPGETFLKNTDIHGTLQDRDDFVDIQHNLLEGNYIKNPNMIHNSSSYNIAYSEVSAYFQYGWTPGSMPVPFGKREVIYAMLNPRADSVYGTSPVQILYEIILTLIYGSRYHLDMYVNNNIPQGIISLMNATPGQIDSFKQRLDERILNQDTFDQWRNKNFTIPVVNQDAKFTPWQLPSKQMEILEQQKWFWKVAFACFGINANEMGDTEDTSRANGMNQSRILKTKAIRPIVMKLQYIWNREIMPELDPEGIFEFKYNDYDIDEDVRVNELYEKKLAYMTVNEIREIENLKPIDGGDVLKSDMNPFGDMNNAPSGESMEKEQAGEKQIDDADKEEDEKVSTKSNDVEFHGKKGKWVTSRGKPLFITNDGVTLGADGNEFVDDSLNEKPPLEILAKYKRQKAGKGKELNIKDDKELQTILKHGHYSLISAGKNVNNPADKDLTPKQAAKRHLQLKKDLEKLGYIYTPVVGKYGEVEDSYLVMTHNPDEKEMVKLGKKYNQDSIIIVKSNKNRMVFTTGSNSGKGLKGDGFSKLEKNTDDNYTAIQTANETFKFSLNFDWDNVKPMIIKAFKVTEELSIELANEIGFNGDMHEFRMGLEIEQEHDATVKNDIISVAKIAKDHLDEDAKYYTKLIKFVEPDKKELLEMKAMPKRTAFEDSLTNLYRKLETTIIEEIKDDKQDSR